MRTEWIAISLLTASLVGCAGPPKPDWVQTQVSAAEQAEAECRQWYEVREAQKNSWCAGMMCFQERPWTRR